MRIKTPQDLSNIDKIEDFQKFVSISIKDIIDALNGKIGLTDNIESSIVQIVFTATGVTVSGAHALGRVPDGYLVISRTTNIQVFDGSTANTNKLIYVQASGAGTVKFLVF